MRRLEATFALLIAVGGAAVAACGAPAPVKPMVAVVSAATALAEAAPSASAVAPMDEPASPAPTRHPMPGPLRARFEAAVTENATCEKCHVEEAKEWKTSLHHRADVEPAYLKSFAIEPLPFCRGCHAPESNAVDEESKTVRELGVGCVTCHVTEPGTVLAVGHQKDNEEAEIVEATRQAPHRIIKDARFDGPSACAGCHQFAFPTRSVRSRADLMQSTMLEHQSSPASGLACQSCHMPFDKSGKKKNHAFTASRNVDEVRRAVKITVARQDATHVRVVLEPNELGHAFPTGDLFRRLEISAEVEGPDHSRLGGQVKFLARHFSIPQGTIGRQLISDDRVEKVASTVDLDVGEAAVDHVVSWRVAYQRVAHPNGIDESSAELEGELTLAEGRLPAPDPPSRGLMQTPPRRE